jgi:ribosomal protein L9
MKKIEENEIVEITPAFMDIPYSEQKSLLHLDMTFSTQDTSANEAFDAIFEKLPTLGPLVFDRVKIDESDTKIYGSVTSQDICNVLKNDHGIVIDQQYISLEGMSKVKDLGIFEFRICMPQKEDCMMVLEVVDSRRK